MQQVLLDLPPFFGPSGVRICTSTSTRPFEVRVRTASSYMVACAQTVVSEKICASSNSPIPIPQQCPRHPHSPRLPDSQEPQARQGPRVSTRGTCGASCRLSGMRAAGQAPRGNANKRAELLRSTAQTTVAPIWLSACRSCSLLRLRQTSERLRFACSADSSTRYRYRYRYRYRLHVHTTSRVARLDRLLQCTVSRASHFQFAVSHDMALDGEL